MKIVPHPCPICGTEHTRTWPSCSPGCQKIWRVKRHNETWNNRYQRNIQQGLCGICGAKAAAGKSKCRAHLKADLIRTRQKREKQKQQRVKEENALIVANHTIERLKQNREVNLDRIRAGVLPSNAAVAKMPRGFVQIEDI